MRVSQGGKELKYQQVLDALRNEILSGLRQRGEKLPSELGLAKRFGTSRITVVRALRELRDMDLIERRGGSGTYVRGIKPTSLTFGLLIPNLGQTEIFERICHGMADAGGQHALLWGQSPEGNSRSEEVLRLCGQYVERHVAGVFFASLEFTGEDEVVNQRIIATLEKARIPVVLLDRCYLPYPQRSRHDLVGIDNARAGYLATEHLVGLGCRRVAFLGRAHAASTVGARISGYRSALLDHNVPLDPLLIQNFDVGDKEATSKFLKAKKPEAIVCASDYIAANLMHSLISLGCKIPSEIRIVGIDDIGFASLLPVPLTTVHQPCREIGMAAMETMLSRLNRPKMPVRDVLLETRLVVRKSCGA